MHIKSLFIGSIAVMLPLLASAGPVSEDEARQKALAFLTSRARSGMRKAAPRKAADMTVAISGKSFYAFNVGRGDGFVLMSASDRTQQVLGYADSGSLSRQAMPEPFRAWLDRLSEAVAAAEDGGLAAAPSPVRAAAAAGGSVTKNYIPTLVKSHWNQGDPYNQQCPTYDNNGQPTLSATGCVATAMAQVMYYWKWPAEACKPIPSYSTDWNNTHTTYDALPAATFRWDAMTDDYGSSSSQDSKDAVAQLMHYVGKSIKMGYGPSSGAASGQCVSALTQYYGYSPNMYLASHDQYTYQQWEDLIYGELAAGRPLLMAGDTSDRTGGHEWVCDGYDGNGLYHMNWGWGGLCDGYFILTVMFPDQQGIGGSTSSDGYSMGQNIIVGLQPARDGETAVAQPARCSVFDIRPSATTLTRTQTTQNFPAFNIDAAYGTNLTYNCDFETAITVYDDEGNIVRERLGGPSFSLNPGTYYPTLGCSVNFGRSLRSGTYYLRWRSRKKGERTWTLCDSGNKNFIKAVISDDLTLTLTAYPHASISVASLSFEGSGTVGSEQKVKAVMTNNDDVEYYNDTYLLVDGSWVSGNCIQIPAHATRDIYFKYTPESAGSHTAQLSTSKNASDAFFSGTLSVAAATQNSLSVTARCLTPNTVAGGAKNIYGNDIRFEVTVTNNAATPYRDYVETSPWELSGSYFWKRGSQRQDVSVGPGETVRLVFEYSGLNTGSRYDFHADAHNASSANLENVVFKRGIYMHHADGSVTTTPYASGQQVDDDVVAVYVPGGRMGITLSYPSAPNKNLTFFFDKKANITSSAKTDLQAHVSNIVIGDEADKIVLYGDEPYYFNQPFTAGEISYVRPAALNDCDVVPLTLPFAPQTATADGSPVSRFTSPDDSGKDYAVSEFTRAAGTALTFSIPAELHAGRPSLLTLAGSCGGTRFSVRGKELVFAATDAQVVQSGTASTYSTDYKFVGTCGPVAVAGAYILSADGSRFVRTASATVGGYGAYFVANNAEAAAAEWLTVGSDVATAIGTVDAADGAAIADGTPVYDLNGRRVATWRAAAGLGSLPHGVYVVGGRKVVR